MPQRKPIPSTNPDLLGGWLPKDWIGDEMPKPKRRRSKAASYAGLKKRDPRLKSFRRRYYEVVAIAAADQKAKRTPQFPLEFKVEWTQKLDGEAYFMTLCQTLYRERACKKVLGEPMVGEDLIERLIYWWAEGPLEPAHLRGAMYGTSLQFGDDDGDD